MTVGCPSVSLFVCLSRRSTAAAVCGWFAAERRAGRRYQSITPSADAPYTSYRSVPAAGAGAQQQTRAASRCEPRREAQHGVVIVIAVCNCAVHKKCHDKVLGKCPGSAKDSRETKVYETQFRPPKQSCLCRVCVGGVNWILDDSRLSRTENLKYEDVNSNCPIHTTTPDTTQTELFCRVN